MKVLITGASGFIGSRLAQRLSKDFEVFALVRSKPKLQDFPKNVKLIYGDITDGPSVMKALKNQDLVFNLAAGLPYHKLTDSGYFDVNVKGAENIFKAALDNKVKRLVHISTVGIYGPTLSSVVNEKSPLNLRDTYSITKAEAEILCRKFIKQGLPATIIRPTIGYGPGDKRPGFLNLFKLINKGFFIPIGQGDNFFHTIYVDNLVDAMILAVTKKAAIGEDFIIGDDPCPTFKEIIESIAEILNRKIYPIYLPKELAATAAKVFDLSGKLGLPTPLNSQRVAFMTENKKYDIGKAKKLLGFKPKIGLQEGLNKTYLWYRQHGYF